MQAAVNSQQKITQQLKQEVLAYIAPDSAAHPEDAAPLGEAIKLPALHGVPEMVAPGTNYPTPPEERTYFRTLILKFYETHHTAQQKDMAAMLNLWRGREICIYRAICRRWEVHSLEELLHGYHTKAPPLSVQMHAALEAGGAEDTAAATSGAGPQPAAAPSTPHHRGRARAARSPSTAKTRGEKEDGPHENVTGSTKSSAAAKAAASRSPMSTSRKRKQPGSPRK